MNDFANSPEAGLAVAYIVGCTVLVGVIVAGLLAERRQHVRRAAHLRAQRAQRDARVRTVPAGTSMRLLRPGERPGVGDLTPPSTRARLLGVDELDPSDDFAGYAEYGGALRQ